MVCQHHVSNAAMTIAYHEIFEAMLTDAESIVNHIEFVLGAGEEWPGGEWTEADEEDCEVSPAG